RQVAQINQGGSQVGARRGVRRVEADRLPEVPDRLVQVALAEQGGGEVIEDYRVPRPGHPCSLEAGDGSLVFPPMTVPEPELERNQEFARSGELASPQQSGRVQAPHFHKEGEG